MKMKRIVAITMTILLVFGGGYAIYRYQTNPAPQLVQQTKKMNKKETIHYVALGDSLTEGVGDESKQGGFVSIVSKNMKDTFSLKEVKETNAGVSGQRSDQILKRVEKEPELQKKLKAADVITVTAGGNDLLKVIRSNFPKLSVDVFNNAAQSYQESITKLMDKLRELNPDAPIYFLGVYNPFYLNFSTITEFQDIVDNWNQSTKSIVEKHKKAYFIPINELLYKGIDPQNQTTTTDGSNLIENDALSQEDKFHPNSTGYRLIAKVIKDELIKTQSQWLIKG